MDRFKLYLFCIGLCFLTIMCEEYILEYSECRNNNEVGKFHRYSYPALERQRNITLGKYKGHVTIVVNVASFWVYTITTYTQLNALLRLYGNKSKCSLKVASFPCNQVRITSFIMLLSNRVSKCSKFTLTHHFIYRRLLFTDNSRQNLYAKCIFSAPTHQNFMTPYQF